MFRKDLLSLIVQPGLPGKRPYAVIRIVFKVAYPGDDNCPGSCAKRVWGIICFNPGKSCTVNIVAFLCGEDLHFHPAQTRIFKRVPVNGIDPQKRK